MDALLSECLHKRTCIKQRNCFLLKNHLFSFKSETLIAFIFFGLFYDLADRWRKKKSERGSRVLILRSWICTVYETNLSTSFWNSSFGYHNRGFLLSRNVQMCVLQRGSLPVILQVRFWVRMALIFRYCQIGETEKSCKRWGGGGGRGGIAVFYCYLLFLFRIAVYSLILQPLSIPCTLVPVLRIRIRDPVPFWPLDPGSRISFFRIPDLGSRISDPGSRIPNPCLRAKWQFFG